LKELGEDGSGQLKKEGLKVLTGEDYVRTGSKDGFFCQVKKILREEKKSVVMLLYGIVCDMLM
jgi:hypothetical protein